MDQLLYRVRGLDVFTRKIAWLVAFLVGALPLIYAPGYGTYATLKYVVLGAIALVLGYYALRILLADGKLARALITHLSFWALVLYLIAHAVVSFTSIDPASSFFSTFTRTDGWFTLVFLLFVFAAAWCALVRGGKVVAGLWLAASVCGAALLSLLITLSPDGLDLLRFDFLQKARAGATIGNSSLAAIYVVWNLFFAVIALRFVAVKERVWVVAALVLMLTSSLFISWREILGRYSGETMLRFFGDARAAILGLAIGSFVGYAVWLIFNNKALYRRIGYALLGFAVAGFVSSGVMLLRPGSLLQERFIDVAGRNRFLFWESAWGGFLSRPITGFGPSTFSDVYHRDFNPERFEKGEAVEVLVDRTHNIFFESLVSGGIVLTLALVIYLGASLVALVRFALRDRFSGSLLIAAWTAWFVQMQFVFDGITSMVTGIVVFALASAFGSEMGDKQPLQIGNRARKLWILAYCVVALVLFWYAVYLPFKKAGTMERVYNAGLPVRAEMWSLLGGISPMGDQYDSALTFNNILDAYTSNLSNFRHGEEALRDAVLRELKGINARLDYLVRDENNRFELVFLAGQFHYLRMYIADQFSLKEVERLTELAERALKGAPNDKRARILYANSQRFKRAAEVLR